MIRIIDNEVEIKKLHKSFINALNPVFNEKLKIFIGYPGGSFEDTVGYSRELDMWFSHNTSNNGRYWNGFGIGKPRESYGHSLTGEINFPTIGINRTIAGTFGKDNEGNILVLHRGKIGGGKKGVGKNLFKEKFYGDFKEALDGERQTNFALVGYLNSKAFPFQVKSFIKEIRRIKDLNQTSTFEDRILRNNFKFNEEHFGKTTGKINRSYQIERNHGIVVNALAEELKIRKIKYGNDKNRDLFIYNSKGIKTIFEIKTDISNQCLYTAIGQLILYGVPIKNMVKLKLVIPEKLNRDLIYKLSSIGIEVLYYDWNNGKPIFENVDAHVN